MWWISFFLAIMESKTACHSLLILIIHVEYIISIRTPAQSRSAIVSHNMRILTGEVNSVVTDEEYMQILHNIIGATNGQSFSVWGLYLHEWIGQELKRSPPDYSRTLHFMNVEIRKIVKWCDASGHRVDDKYARCKETGLCTVHEVSIKDI